MNPTRRKRLARQAALALGASLLLASLALLSLLRAQPQAVGRIAFSSWRDGNGEIYIVGTDGSNLTRLTHDPAIDSGPAWSPDGKQIAFGSTRDTEWRYQLYQMNADGSKVTRLTDSPGRTSAPLGLRMEPRSRSVPTATGALRSIGWLPTERESAE